MTDQPNTILRERLKKHIERNPEHRDPAKRRDAFLAQDALNEIERLSADLAPMVKPLEWKSVDWPDEIGSVWTAAQINPDYTIYEVVSPEEGIFFLDDTIGGPVGDYRYDTLKEAKAAAQADYERRILSALTHAPTGWQPIETAPKDGTYILIKLMNDEVFSAHWQVGNKCWHGSHSDIGPFNPVSWMHIPGDAAAQISPEQAAKVFMELGRQNYLEDTDASEAMGQNVASWEDVPGHIRRQYAASALKAIAEDGE